LQLNITKQNEDFAKKQMEWEDTFSKQQKIINQFTQDHNHHPIGDIEEIMKKSKIECQFRKQWRKDDL